MACLNLGMRADAAPKILGEIRVLALDVHRDKSLNGMTQRRLVKVDGEIFFTPRSTRVSTRRCTALADRFTSVASCDQVMRPSRCSADRIDVLNLSINT